LHANEIALTRARRCGIETAIRTLCHRLCMQATVEVHDMRAERIPEDVVIGAFHKTFDPVSVESWRDNNQLLKDAPGYHETMEVTECKYAEYIRGHEHANEFTHLSGCCSKTSYPHVCMLVI
jgi:hypothetical protein